jgi:UDP-N-acetylglucosamine:LPS N-acetylglucosamine transferase
MIQDDFTTEDLAKELFRLLEPVANKEVRGKLSLAARKLGQGGASSRAAQAILELIGG